MTVQWLIRNEGNEVVASGRSRADIRRAYDSAAHVADAIERALLAMADGLDLSQAREGERV